MQQHIIFTKQTFLYIQKIRLLQHDVTVICNCFSPPKTEQIRRANRLFAQDSLFLRQFLMVPISKDSQFYPSDDRQQQPVDEVDSAAAAGSGKVEMLTALSPEEENRKVINDFLGKIDSNLAETRRYVAKSQTSFEYVRIHCFSFVI